MLRVAVLGDTESIQGFAAIGLDIFPCDDPGLAPGLFHRLCGGEYGVVRRRIVIPVEALDEWVKTQSQSGFGATGQC